ncbi:hypothetical protein [Obesumbacterium proteus]|uniref:hypothetical protein n=1 Tax=Obesumbacterium proteus TaxID=82983 RepID=UPI00242E244C|nr:hypothetical protein [Obesumbacterium proteus]
MNNDKKTSSQPDGWVVIFTGLVGTIKIIFSIVLAIAGSKIVTSTNDEKIQEGYRNGHSGYGYYDRNNQRIYSDYDK